MKMNLVALRPMDAVEIFYQVSQLYHASRIDATIGRSSLCGVDNLEFLVNITETERMDSASFTAAASSGTAQRGSASRCTS
jgi:hypothetical protein